MGGNSLSLDRGDPVNTEYVGRLGYTAADDPPHGCSLGDLLDIGFGPGGIAELKQPHVVKHTDGTAHLDGVKAQFIASTVHPGHGIEVVDPQVGAQHGHGFIFQRGSDMVAVSIVENRRTPDNTTRHTGIAHGTAPGVVEFDHGVGIEPLSFFKGAVPVVPGGKAAAIAVHIDADIGPQGMEDLP